MIISLCLTALSYIYIFFLMIRQPPRSTRTDTRFPYTTLFRSHAFCKTKKGKGGFGRFHADPADGPIGNGGDKTQACGGDDTDRPFRADQQLLYVIAAVVLLERIQAMMNTAVWQHRLNPFDKRSHGAMTQHLRSACIG